MIISILAAMAFLTLACNAVSPPKAKSKGKAAAPKKPATVEDDGGDEGEGDTEHNKPVDASQYDYEGRDGTGVTADEPLTSKERRAMRDLEEGDEGKSRSKAKPKPKANQPPRDPEDDPEDVEEDEDDDREAEEDEDEDDDEPSQGADDEEEPEDSLTRRARRIFSDDDLEDADPKTLERLVSRYEDKIAEIGRKALEGQAGNQNANGNGSGNQQQPPAGENRSPPPNANGNGNANQGLKKYALKLSKDSGIEPDLLEDMQGIVDHYHSQMQQVHSMLGGFFRQQFEQQQRQTNAQIDKLFTKLGDDYVDLFGKGQTKRLAKDSDELKNRLKVLERMRHLAVGYEGQGDDADMPDLDELHASAVASVFRQHQEKLVRRKVNKQIRDRKTGQFSNRPTHRRSQPRTAEEEAEGFVHDFMESRGVDTGRGGNFRDIEI